MLKEEIVFAPKLSILQPFFEGWTDVDGNPVTNSSLVIQTPHRGFKCLLADFWAGQRSYLVDGRCDHPAASVCDLKL